MHSPAPQKAEQSYPIKIVYSLQAHDQQVPPEVEQRRKDDIFGFDEGKAEKVGKKMKSRERNVCGVYTAPAMVINQ